MPGGILTLDLGGWTGWAHATAAAVDVWPPPIPGRTGPLEGVTYGARRWQPPVHIDFRRFLDKMLADLAPAAVVFEAVHAAHTFKSHAAVRDLLQLAGAAESVCNEHGISCYDEHNGRIKKHFCGHGRATKRDIMDRCRQRGWTPQRHDTADALALLDRAVWMLHLRHRGRAA